MDGLDRMGLARSALAALLLELGPLTLARLDAHTLGAVGDRLEAECVKECMAMRTLRDG